MIKAIIVDDEQITRKGLLEFVHWETLNIEVVGEATDGQEGLALAGKVQPDIAICDVRMPKMDGIELANHIKEILPYCKIIFLSGYSDTNYLKSAIKLKAVDYIEKPFNLGEFESLLNKTAKAVTEERLKRLEEQRIKMKMEKSIPYFKNTLITSILKSQSMDIDKIKEGLELLNIKFPLNSSYICSVFKAENNEDSRKILEIINNTGVKRGIYFISGIMKEEVIVLIALKEKGGINEIISYGNEVLNIFTNKHGKFASGALGSQVSSLEELKNSYEDAGEAIKTKGYKKSNSMIIYDPNKDRSIIRDIENHIQQNYNKNISINSIAASVYLTPQYLCKVYKKETGETVNDYITKVRIEASKALLKDRKYKLYEIADKVGYNDANYYARVFKKITGINPSEYRDIN
ncbi:response regulator [Clostridium polynesiense]|uniref:response regulator n=1 Tax=Clostridium polynesiense TaxID=1325933 RepID=UPI00058DE566|nr:response regulator [Clostridium polynesiense]